VSVLAGFSGHGFKLAPYFGELGADLATGVELSEIAVRIFSPRRFDRAGADA
jgi:sarcosine oxidase